MYPDDEEPVYEVSELSLSSCDFKELQALQFGMDPSVQLTPQEC